MGKCFLFISAISGFLSVAFGAFGAHALKSKLDDYHLGVFHTAVEYQYYHTFALALVGLLMMKIEVPLLRVSGWAFIFGMIVFSGSLYTLALSGQRFWGAITPIGGVAFLIGWALLAYSSLKL